MSDNVNWDDFDPEYHTPQEIRAHYEARYEADPEFRERVDVTADLIRQGNALDKLADEDPMGFVFSGQVHDGRTAEQADAWLDSRLARQDPPK